MTAETEVAGAAEKMTMVMMTVAPEEEGIK